MPAYFVRLGALAEVHPARCPYPMPRDRRVVVRTPLGLRLGEVAGPCRHTDLENAVTIVRPTSDADEWLIRRLARRRRQAVERCRAALKEAGSQAILLEIDPILDGTKLLLHFLGPVDRQAESITQHIVEEYEAVVRTRQVTQRLQEGCGPQCGQPAGEGAGGGCGPAGCSGCAAGCHAPTDLSSN